MTQRKYAVIIYPNFSLQEITCLTSCLSIWFDEKIDYIASEKKIYSSEEGFQITPTKTVDEVNVSDYTCVILPGTVFPLPALYDDKLIDFLRKGKDSDTLFAAISSSPILLSKAGVLDGKDFTSGYFMQMADTFPFVEKKHFVHKPIVESGNVITGIGMFFREFAECVLHRLGYDIGDNFMNTAGANYSEEELTFYWTDDEYKEFLEELKEYTE
ncbi:MAG: DJ-1/PfpI family protein [Clostridiales bacterium]|nr:DJ-1/PfpI family protein [Clostridiales bacterium]